MSIAGVVTFATGLGVRHVLTGWTAKYPGVALWSTLVYFTILWVAPKLSVRQAFVTCIAISFAVELLQLSPGPMALYEVHPAFGLVFGTTFHAPDLLVYPVGAGLGAAVYATARLRSERATD